MKRWAATAILVVISSGCCDGAAPSTPGRDMAPASFSSPCVWGAGDGGAFECLPDTVDGCICGAPDPADHTRLTGSCGHGYCCTGCWDDDGTGAKCWPGDGTGGWYGSHGQSCKTAPTNS